MPHDHNANESDSRSNAAQELAAGALLELEIAGVQVNFRWAPAGTFLMGSPDEEQGRAKDERQHEVTLTKGFWIAETETTQELWQAVTGYNPSEFKDSKNLPVENVSWNDCRDFVDRLNAKFRQALPCGFKYAMPTEAQWEYACRAGTSTPFYFGSSLHSGKANINRTRPHGSGTKGYRHAMTMPVKSYAPNAWGLYDMHGNVMEWCADWYGENYYASSSAGKDPTGPDGGSTRVLRDGAWDSNVRSTRAANRSVDAPGDRYNDYGFRMVLIQDDSQLQDDSDSDLSDDTRAPGAITMLEINGVEVNFHWAPAGTFRMGSPESEEGRRCGERLHDVTLTQGFWIAETQTTQRLWQAVMGNNPSVFIPEEEKAEKPAVFSLWGEELREAAMTSNPEIFAASNELPVENVSWDDCQAFVDKLNSDFRRALPYGYKYAMPTEAQWEYACRAGTTTPFNFGSSLNGDRANCNGTAPYGNRKPGDYEQKTAHVKSFFPNPWGLYDMHGNVLEWCADWYSEDYYASPCATLDPTGPETGSARVLRGGSWLSYPRTCRSADRYDCAPSVCHETCGVRLVLVKDMK